MPSNSPFTQRVLWCARCHGEHEQVEFRPFSKPLDIQGWVATHWAPCPTNGDPILMKVSDDEPELMSHATPGRLPD